MDLGQVLLGFPVLYPQRHEDIDVPTFCTALGGSGGLVSRYSIDL